MNVFRCARFKRYGKYCAFAHMDVGPDGKPVESSARCALKGRPRDEYRLIPEHDSSTGQVIYQRDFRLNNPLIVGASILWESLSHHDTGLTFFPDLKVSKRTGRKTGRRPEDKDMHPLYSLEEINEPVATSISEQTALVPFGSGDNLSFSATGYRTQKTRGIQRIETCFPGIYGIFEPAQGMVTPKCIIDQYGRIPNWQNFTNIPSPNVPRAWSLILVNSNQSQIEAHCIKWFGRSKLAVVMVEILLAIKNGAYVPLALALRNNGVPEQVVDGFLRDTNVASKPRRELNLFKYFRYYKYLKTIPPAKSLVFRANLVNYLLNNDALSNVDPTKPDTYLKDGTPAFSHGRRYWWLLLIIKDAMKVETVHGRKVRILNPARAPSWLDAMIDTYMSDREMEPEIEIPSAPFVRLMDIVGDFDKSREKDPDRWARKARVFTGIARAGKRWTLPEIRVAWHEFTRAFDGKSPYRFWEWVESVKTATDEQAKKKMLISQSAVTNLVLETAPERAFAHHLLLAMKSRNSFMVEEPHPYGRWMQMHPKGVNLFKEGSTTQVDHRDIFWKEYMRVKRGRMASILFGKAKRQLMLANPAQAAMLIAEARDEAAEDLMFGDAVDRDDIGVFGSGRARVIEADGVEAMLPRSSNPETDDVNFDDAEPNEHLHVDEAAKSDTNKSDAEDEKGGEDVG